MDVFTRKKRSWIMGRIRSKNTKPEIIVRSILHRMGYRYSLGHGKLPGSPDIVLPKYRTAVFVHGCFWHRHKGCKVTTMPKTRVGFWKKKFERNVERDKRNLCELRRLGWKTIVIWECQALKDPEKLGKRLFDRITRLRMDTSARQAGFSGCGKTTRKRRELIYEIPEMKELLKIAEKRADYSRKAHSSKGT